MKMNIWDFLIGLCWVVSIQSTLLQILKRLGKIEKYLKLYQKKVDKK
jgi:hypothetical protein